MKRPTIKTSLFTLAGATSILAFSSASVHASGEVNVYSARSEALIAPLL